jgi:hypothetical protein
VKIDIAKGLKNKGIILRYIVDYNIRRVSLLFLFLFRAGQNGEHVEA